MSAQTASTIETTPAQPAVAPAAPARIQWAAVPGTTNPELEARFEAMRSRNWITDRMVQQYQKHWHCSREQALERLLPQAGQ